MGIFLGNQTCSAKVPSWASGQTVVVDACTNLLNPLWLPQQTNMITNCMVYFSDAQWMNYPSRYYRVRSQ